MPKFDDVELEAFLDDIRDALAGPLSDASGFRYFDEHDSAGFKKLWGQLKPPLKIWAAKCGWPARKVARARAERKSKKVFEQDCPTVSQLETAQQLYSKLTEKRPRKPRRSQKHKLTPTQSDELLKLVQILPSNVKEASSRKSALATYLRDAMDTPKFFGDSVAEFERRLRSAVGAGIVPTIRELTIKNPPVYMRAPASAAPENHSLGPGPELGRRAARIYNVDRAHWQALRTWL